jgi:membrane protein implicated in regulation of membrane protease activity
MDDLGDRFLKSLGIILGGYLFIYFLIVITGQHRFGVSALIYQGMNFVFLCLVRIVLVSVIGLILFHGVAYYFKSKTKKEKEELERAKKLEQELIREEIRIREQEEVKIKAEVELEKEKLKLIEIEKRQAERKKFFLNRSAEKANDDALKHFL